ncbi:hypothetical protein D3C85_1049020 [compost metagenome]
MIEPLVDLVQRKRFAHHPVHRQLAGFVQVDVAADVDGGHARPQVAAAYVALFAHHLRERQREAELGVGQARRDGGAAAPGQLVGGLERGHGARHVKAVVHAATGQVEEIVVRLDLLGVDHVGRAQLLGQGEFFIAEIHGDDAPRAGRNSRQQGRQAHAAQPHDGGGVASLDARPVQHRARARQHGAAEQRGLAVAQFNIDLHA